MAEEFKKLHPYCHGCKKSRVAQKDGPLNKKTGKPEFKKGDFIVKCKGIPDDYNFIPNYEKIKHKIDSSIEDQEYLKAMYDPVLWAKLHVDWEPREANDGTEYQAIPLRCTSKRKVLRWGRRLGKTDSMCIAILHYLFTNSPHVKRWDETQGKYVDGFSTILVLAPYLAQIKLIFERINKLIEKSTSLSNEIKRNISNPYHTIELYNGAKVVGFPSGAKSGSGAESVRGQKADFIVLDEMDYLRAEDLDNILALLMEHSDVSLLAASTPSGRRDYFWKWCIEDMNFKEYHFNSTMNPSWSDAMELELREFYQTEIAWQHEIMAEFGESATGVFQTQFVEAAVQDYKHEKCTRHPDRLYSLGVDWNDHVNGTKFYITELDLQKGKFRTVAKESVQKAGWTQTSSVAKVIELNRKWRFDFIYVDEGYGATQIELLKKHGMEAELRGDKIDAKLKDIKGINMSSKIEVFDPLTQLPKKQMIKPYMVNNAVRRFERGQMEISAYNDETLFKQLLGYNVAKISASGVPVYEPGGDGDHDLDAFMLSLLGFALEMSEFTSVKFSGSIAIAGKFGEKTLETQLMEARASGREVDLTKINSGGKKEKPEPVLSRTKDLYNGLTGVPSVATIKPISGRIYSPEAFRSDSKRAGLPMDTVKGTLTRRPKRKTF